MIKVESNIEEFKKKLRTNVEQLKNIINAATLKEALRIQSEIRIEWPADTGESRQQIIVREVKRKNGVEYQVIANSEHAKYIDNIDPDVEFVRRPAHLVGKDPIKWLPNLGAIEDWATRKGIRVGGENTDGSDIIFAIAYAIARDGVKNAKIFYTVMTEAGKLMEKNITAEVRKNFK